MADVFAAINKIVWLLRRAYTHVHSLCGLHNATQPFGFGFLLCLTECAVGGCKCEMAKRKPAAAVFRLFSTHFRARFMPVTSDAGGHGGRHGVSSETLEAPVTKGC